MLSNPNNDYSQWSRHSLMQGGQSRVSTKGVMKKVGSIPKHWIWENNKL